MKLKISTYFFCTLCLLGGYTPARADLLAHGTPDKYWIAQMRPDPTGGVPKSVIRYRGVGDSTHWRIIAQFNAPVIALASRGSQLAALLDSGDWMLIWESSNSSGPLPEDGSKILQLAGEEETWWAIAAAKSGRPPTTSGSTQPATTLPAGTQLLYRLEQGRWVMLGPVPGSASLAHESSLNVIDGMPMLALLRDNGHIETWQFDMRDNVWRSAGNLNGPPDATGIRLLAGNRRLSLWAGDERSGGVVFHRNDVWSAPIPLSVPSDALGDGLQDVTIAGESIRLLAQGGGIIIENSFSPNGADRRRVDLPLTLAPQGPGQFEWVSALSAAALMLVLLNSFRRREPINLERIETKGMTLATPTARLMAGILDALPIFVTAGVVIARIDPARADDMEAMMAVLNLPMILATAVYILHVLICELLWGWSLGKKLFGLRVVMLDGSAPTRRAIFLRNLLRIIDVSMMFLPTMLVAISPLRQRVGDVAAETIVVTEKKNE